MSESYPNLDMPHAYPHVPNETTSSVPIPLSEQDCSVDTWNAAIDAAINEINRMMYAPSPRYDSLGRMTLTCAAKKIDALRKNVA